LTYMTISKMPTLQEQKTRLEMLCRNLITGTFCGKGRVRRFCFFVFFPMAAPNART